MSVISRSALESSSLADLHEIAGELGLDGYRRLRKADLVDTIIGRQGADPDSDSDSAVATDGAVAVATSDDGADADADGDTAERPARRSRRGGRSRSRTRDRDPGDVDGEDEATAEPAADAAPIPSARSSRPPRVTRENGAARGERSSDRDRASDPDGAPDGDDSGARERPAARDRSAVRDRSAGSERGADREPGSDRDRSAGSNRSADRDRSAGSDRSADRDRSAGSDRDRSSGGSDRGAGRDRSADRERTVASGDERDATGTVDLLPNGSGFLRVSPPEASDDDVYISAAQVRRCELVAGDEVAGPVRSPRRSERYPSLIRVDTINGRSAEEVSEGTKYDDLPCTYATERIALDIDDVTLKAIEWLTPLGRGSRVAIIGGARAGKTEALRRIAGALAGREDLECSVVLAGVRPEEVQDWRSGPLQPVSELTLSAAADVQGQAIERAVETGRRVAARGGHAVVLVDTLEHVPAPLARRTLAAARNIVDGGSLTIIATAREALGGETTVIALDAELAGSGRIPALDLAASGTIRPELLVGEKGAEAIAEARAAAIGG